MTLDPESFTDILVGDVQSASDRLSESDTPTNRRDFVRAVFSAIEGLLWQLKQDVHRHAGIFASLSIHEKAALFEESYSVDDRGNVRSQPKFLPLPTAIRLVVNVVRRYRPDYQVDFNHIGWSNLRIAIEVRNRIVHPKQMDDLTVTETEISQCHSAFSWILALVIEVLRETNTHLKELTVKMPSPGLLG